MNNKYHEALKNLLDGINKDCSKEMERVARLLKKTVDDGGLVYVFGAGHSSIITQEVFHRAGGLIPVYPVLHDFLSPHVSHKIAGKMERLTGVAKIVFERCGAKSGDMMFIASNSGINAVAIEMALECKSAGVRTVALTSLQHSLSVQSRHSSGKRLFDLCDHVLDNHCPSGDGLVVFEEGGEGDGDGDGNSNSNGNSDGYSNKTQVAAGSTIANSFLYHSVLVGACELWVNEARPPGEANKLPIYRSANLPGGDEHNAKMEAIYSTRIPLLS